MLNNGNPKPLLATQGDFCTLANQKQLSLLSRCLSVCKIKLMDVGADAV